MAKEKKVFSISINGLTESIDAVKGLNEELRACDGIIKNLKDAKIEVKVSAGTTTTTGGTQKVGSGKGSSDDKVGLEIEKEKTKQLQMQNDELREQLIQREQLKQANKEALDDIKDEAKGYAEVNEGVKTYANTLNGMSAELRDIKKELRNTDVKSEAFDTLTKKAAALNEKLKKAEMAYGQFGRNVGNYTESILKALEEWNDADMSVDFNIDGVEGSLNNLKMQLRELKQYWSNLSPDDAKYNKTVKAIKSLTNQINDMEDALKDVGAEANSVFTGRFTTTIGGVEATFSNASEACEALRKKLVAMRVAGEENTPMYTEIIQLVRRLSKEVKIAQQEVGGMTKTTQNMGKVIGVMRGFSSIAALGQGIAGLFGGASENLEKFMARFASFTMVLASLKELQELINSGEGAWGKLAQSADKALDKMFGGVQKIVDATNAIKEYQKAQEELEKFKSQFNLDDTELRRLSIIQQLNENLYEQIQLTEEQIKATAGASDEWKNIQRLLQDDDGTVEYLHNTLGPALDEFKAKFPELGNAINMYVAQVRSLDDANMQVTEGFKKYQESLKNVQDAEDALKDVTDSMGPKTLKFAQSLNNMGKFGKFAANGLNILATGIKTVMKATVAMMVVEALAVAVEYLGKVLSSIGDGIGYLVERFLPIYKVINMVKEAFLNLFGVMSDNQIAKLNKDLDLLETKLKALDRDVEVKVSMGDMGEVEGQLQKVNNQLELLGEIQKRLVEDDNIKTWAKDALGEIKDKDIKTLNKDYQDTVTYLQKVSQLDESFWKSLEGKSTKEQFETLNSTLGITEEQLENALNVLNGDDIDKFIDKLTLLDADFNDIGADGVKAFGRLAQSIDNARKATTQAASRIKKDIQSLTKQEWSLKLALDAGDLDTRLALVKMDMDEMANNYGMKIDQYGKVSKRWGQIMTSEEKEIADHLEKINKYQIEAAKKADKDAKKRDADDAKRRADDAKRRAKEARDRARNEANTRIEAMEDGMDKEIAAIQQKRKEELEDAKDNGKRTVDINIIYDRQILNVKKKYAKYLEDLQREHNKRLLDIMKDFLEQWKDLQREIEDTRADTSMGDVENRNISVKQSITYDTTTKNEEGINEQKKYYEKLKQNEIEYLKEKERLETEESEREHKRLIEDEMARYESERASQKESIEELERNLKERVESHQISEEEANKMIQETREQYQKGEQKSLELHNEKMVQIAENAITRRKNIELQYDEERKQATASALEQQRQVTQDFYHEIDKIMERTQKRSTNQFGFINYNTFKKSISDALEAVKITAKQIEDEKKKLQKALDNNEISFDDFKKAKKELDDFAEEVKDKTKEIQDSLKGSFNSWLSGVLDNVSQYTSVLNDMFSTISDMYNRQLDAQQEKIDKEQEMLDKELEMIEENLEKQEEITARHNDNIDDAEEELKNSRGDRRQALIDQIAAERKLAEESIKEERRLTEEKKRNAQKQEQLKQQQDALDKKRKQQEKRSAIVQATINTFTAVSNALAVQPWFVGLALSAVALGLGMANVAQIKSQQYADGGLLNGKRHSQGGMKIQGSNIEVEGGEYVTNRVSTKENLPLLEYINSSRRTLTKDDLVKFYDNGKTTLISRQMTNKFEEGGELPQLSVDVKKLMNGASQSREDEKPIVVSVVDIVSATDNYNTVRVLAGDVDND